MITRRDFAAACAAATFPADNEEGWKARMALRDRLDDEISVEAREALRERLQSALADFLLEPTAGELYLLCNVLTDWGANEVCAGAELPLASAFAIELARDEVYFKVPEELRDEVEALIEERLSKTPAPAQT